MNSALGVSLYGATTGLFNFSPITEALECLHTGTYIRFVEDVGSFPHIQMLLREIRFICMNNNKVLFVTFIGGNGTRSRIRC